MSLNITKVRDEGRCTGCAMCKDVCPNDSIVIEAADGFYRPSVLDSCTNCGLCNRLCPQNSPQFVAGLKSQVPEVAIATWCKDESNHFEASSGGLITEISKAFLKNDCFVAGAWFNPLTERVEHKVCHSEEELFQIRGSKYVLSNKSGLYEKIAEALRNSSGLFVGVPCEVAAVKRYMHSFIKGVDNVLYTIELLCHGGSSPQCLHEHLVGVSHGKKIGNISFRGGENDCKLCVFDADGKIIYKGSQYVDPYFKYFMRHTLFQPVCFSCQYVGCNRIGDLTIGDFWGLDEATLKLSANKGTNMVLVNSEFGEKMMELVKAQVEIHPRPVIEAINGNDTLREPTPKEVEYDALWEAIGRRGFYGALHEVYRYYWHYETVLAKAKTAIIKAINKTGLIKILKRIKDFFFRKNKA